MPNKKSRLKAKSAAKKASADTNAAAAAGAGRPQPATSNPITSQVYAATPPTQNAAAGAAAANPATLLTASQTQYSPAFQVSISAEQPRFKIGDDGIKVWETPTSRNENSVLPTFGELKSQNAGVQLADDVKKNTNVIQTTVLATANSGLWNAFTLLELQPNEKDENTIKKSLERLSAKTTSSEHATWLRQAYDLLNNASLRKVYIEEMLRHEEVLKKLENNLRNYEFIKTLVKIHREKLSQKDDRQSIKTKFALLDLEHYNKKLAEYNQKANTLMQDPISLMKLQLKYYTQPRWYNLARGYAEHSLDLYENDQDVITNTHRFLLEKYKANTDKLNRLRGYSFLLEENIRNSYNETIRSTFKMLDTIYNYLILEQWQKIITFVNENAPKLKKPQILQRSEQVFNSFKNLAEVKLKKIKLKKLPKDSPIKLAALIIIDNSKLLITDSPEVR